MDICGSKDKKHVKHEEFVDVDDHGNSSTNDYNNEIMGKTPKYEEQGIYFSIKQFIKY